MIEEQSPSERLATLTVDQLIAAGLLRADKRELAIEKIASGQMKADEWQLQIDLGVEKAGEA